MGSIIATAAFLLSLLLGVVSKSAMPMLIIRPLIFAVLFFIISNVVYFMVSRFLPELLDDVSLTQEDTRGRPGARLNILEDDPEDYGQGDYPGSYSARSGHSFMGAQADDSDEGLGNISDFVMKTGVSPALGTGIPSGKGSAGLDQNTQTGYTEGKKGNIEEFSEPGPSLPSDGGKPVESGTAGRDSPAASIPEKPKVPLGTVAEEAADSSESVDFLPDLDSMAGAFLSHLSGEDQDTTEYSVSTPLPKPSMGNRTPEWAGDFNAKELAKGLRTVLKKEKEG